MDDAATVIEIRELAPGLRDDFLSFFDNEAFQDNPRWESCYCYFPHAPHAPQAPQATGKWDVADRETNRAASAERIRAGEMHGYLAYLDGNAVGWCNANDRSSYTILEPAEEVGVGAIVCFVVAKPHRGKGIAARLLAAACEGFRARGVRIIEAFPLAESASESDSESANHYGPLRMYLAAGFAEVGVEGPNVVVRKLLGDPI